MAFGEGIDTERARAVLARVGLSDRLNDRPRQLSVGQQQRVALARALVHRPKVVLADEPTGNLDPERAREAIDLLLEVAAEAGSAVLVVSHDPATLARFRDVRDLASINAASGAASSPVAKEP